MIKFGIRQSFDKIEQVEERYSNINVPVEVALPYYWDIYAPIRVHLREIADKIKSYQTEVLSVHAVQAPITNEEFRIWGKGIKLILAKEPKTIFKEVGTLFITVFKRKRFVGSNKEDATQKTIGRLGEKLGVKLGENEEKILNFIISDKFATIDSISQSIKISTTAVENNLTKLKKKKLIRRIGPDKGGHWHVLRSSPWRTK